MKYSLKEFFLQEVAKRVQDLPDNVSIAVGSGLLGGIEVSFTPNDEGIVGSVSVVPAKSGCRGANIVTHAKATKGYGPLLYDLAIELAGGSGVTPDRDSVSSDASNVWKYYFEKRSDIIHKPLDDEDNPKTPPKEDDCSFDASRAGGSINFLNSSDEIQRPWLNYVYYASGTPTVDQLKKVGKLVVEGQMTEDTVPQGSPDERPLHGPTYYYPVGRSLPKKFRDNGGKSKARKWNKDGSLVDVKKIDKKAKKKKRWYAKEEVTDEVVKESFELFVEILRQDSPWSTKIVEKISRKESSGRTKPRETEQIREVSSLVTTAVEASNIEPEQWERDNAPRVSKVGIKKNKEYIAKLDVTEVNGANGIEVYIDHMDPQYKRQISMVKTPKNTIPHKEPKYLEGRGEHRISKLGYAKIADRFSDLKTDVYLSPYDPNWKKSEEMMQQVVKHWIANHGNRSRIYPEPDATMMVSIKEAWDELIREAAEVVFYHGTNQEFSPGDKILPPSVTDNISEKGRKKNLDKVFFTVDKGSAKIYAGRAVQALGGEPHVYIVKPSEEPEWLNRTKGTTVLMAPSATVIRKV